MVHKREYSQMHFVVIEVRAFPSTVHICKSDYPNVLRKPAIYVRTDNNESAEVGTTQDFNHLVERSIRNRSDQMLTQFRSVLVGAKLEPSQNDLERFQSQIEDAESTFECRFSDDDPRIGFLQYAVWPAHFDESRYTLAEIRNAADVANRVDFHQWFNPLWPGVERPSAIQDGIESWNDLREPNRVQFWRLPSSGFLFHRQTMYDDAVLDGQFGVHQPGQIMGLERLIAVVGMSVHNLINAYRTLEVSDEEVSLRFEVINCQGRRLRAPARWTIIDTDLISRIPRVRSSRTAPIEEWIANAHGLASDLVSDLMQRFNALDPVYPDNVLHEVFER